MNTITPPKVAHFKKFPRHEPTHLDSSALNELKKCPKKFFLRYILGYTTKDEGIHFTWGKAYHKFREMLDKRYKEDKDNNSMQPLMTYVAFAMQDGMKIWGTRRGTEGTKYEFMTPERLAETLAIAGKHWIQEKERKQIEVIDTEQPFNQEIVEGIHRTGRFDQVITKDGRLWGRDFKTSTKDEADYERFLYPNDQFIGYTAAQHLLNGGDRNFESVKVKGQYVEVMYNANTLKRKNEKKGPKLFTKIVEFTPQMFRDWINSQKYWDAARKAMRENDHYPMNETHCAWCMFHRVCKLPTESSQEYELRVKYKFEIWDNSKDEGDS